MHNSIIKNLAEPVFTRIGTMAGTGLAAYGLSATHQVTVAQAVTLLLGLALDLVLRQIVRARGR